MDFIRFNTQNNEFIIELSKKLKPISWSTFAKYICNITFKNSIGNKVLSIQCSEREIMDALQSLNAFQMNYGNTISDNIYFQSNINNSYFIYVSSLENAYINIENVSPTEEDYFLEDRLQMSIYENSINGNILRLYLEMDYYYLEDFIFKLYLLIEDIPYLNDMSNTSLLEYLDYNATQLPD